jgi:hypothetical protein
VNEDLAQGGTVPSVTKPEPLPKKSGNGPDKKIPTLPLQTKRDTTKQGVYSTAVARGEADDRG